MGIGSDQVLVWMEMFSYPSVLALLLACGMGAPLSEDLIVLCAGILVARGAAHLPAMLVVTWVGVLAGDSLLYRIGKKLGPRALAHPRLSKVLTAGRVSWVKAHFARRGLLTILFARFLPGVRAPTFLIAGMGEVPFRRFLLADGLAAAVLAPTFTLLGYHFGLHALAGIRRASFWLLLAVAAAISLVVVARWVVRWRKARALARA